MLSISGIKKAKAPPVKPAFAEDDDDDMDVLARKAAKKPLPPTRVNAPMSRTARDQLKAAQEMDASVFEYDEVFDQMKAGQKAAEEKRKAASSTRQPQYVQGLLASAIQRKNDRIRAEDVMTARARAQEGDEFADKDSFVTPAYLAQQEELRKAEEAEKLQEAQGVKKGGMAAFYSSYLDNSSASHQAAMEGASKGKDGPQPIQPQYDEEPVSDVHLAREAAKSKGKLVELNEDGQIIDRTQLLTGGLNVLKKPKTAVQGPSFPKPGDDYEAGFSVPISQRKAHVSQEAPATAPEEPHYSGLSEAQRRRLQRERQSALLERQMIELEERKRKAAQDEENRQVKKVARRNDESKVEQLKRLAAERRAQKKAAEQAMSATEPTSRSTAA